MLRILQKIEIYDYSTGAKKYILPNLESIEIVTSKLEFTDKTMVKFKDEVSGQNKRIEQVVTRGDNIKIYLGYFDNLSDTLGLIKEFDGYITNIKTGAELTCEDSMYLLKQQTIEPKIFKATNLKEIINYYYKGQTEILNTDIGDWMIGKNCTLMDFFDEINQKFGILTYFQDGILYCNAELNRTPEQTVIMDITGNVVLGSDDITLETDEGFNVVVHGISPQQNGTKIERWAAYKDLTRTQILYSSQELDGVQNEINVPDRTTAELDKLLEIRLKRAYEATTFGTLKTFGVPTIKHGDRILVKNSKEKDKNGYYESVGVTKTLDLSEGYKQIVQLGLKIS